MAPRNSFSACLRAPRGIHISDSVAYFTGVAKNDRIGEDRLDLLSRGHVIPPGLEVDRQSGGFTPHAPLNRIPLGCSTGVESLGYSTGAPQIQHKVFKKLHQRSVSGAFLCLLL